MAARWDVVVCHAVDRLSTSLWIHAPILLPGADVTMAKDGERVRARWPGEWLNIVVDGEEHLLALLSEDCSRVHQAVWSSSPYLSVLHPSGMASEICMERL